MNQVIENQTQLMDIATLLTKIESLETRLAAVERRLPEDRVAIVLTSNELDKVMPAFIIAAGAKSMGMEAEIYFTLWGLTMLKRKPVYEGKNVIEKMLTMMMPGNIADAKLSKMHYFGAGTAMMKAVMAKHNIASLPELMETAQELGVDLLACQMTMGMMGIQKHELIDNLVYCGVAKYLDGASRSKITLFM